MRSKVLMMVTAMVVGATTPAPAEDLYVPAGLVEQTFDLLDVEAGWHVPLAVPELYEVELRGSEKIRAHPEEGKKNMSAAFEAFALRMKTQMHAFRYVKLG